MPILQILQKAPFITSMTVLITLLSGCALPVHTSTNTSSNSNSSDLSIDQQAVRQTFNAYKYALLNDLGPEATDMVSEKTLRHYDQLRQYALASDATELKELTSFNRLVVLGIRHNVAPALLRKMQGKEIFAYGVKNQWVAKDSVAPFELGYINAYGNYASGEILHKSMSTQTTSEFRLEFRKENDVWRINLLPLLERIGRERSAQLNASQDENKAILTIIEQMSGRKVDASIWTPPGRE